MKTVILDAQEVLQSYDIVSQIYPYIPSLSHWRAWEHAAYQRYNLDGHILDIGCGDGQYFRLLWPQLDQVTGVDMSPAAVIQAEQSGVYQKVHQTQAHQIPESDATFDQVFANCSLEHMDYLDQVLAEIYRCLKPQGTLLCSVVTHRFIDWAWLARLVSMAGFETAATNLKQDFLDYHHLANPLTPEIWKSRFIQAKLIPEEYIPIVPRYNSSAFLLIDSLWHLKQSTGGEIGDKIFPVLLENPNFPSAFRTIIDGLLKLEMDWHDCSGAVFLVRKVA